MRWTKSSFCESASCIEVVLVDSMVLLRDSDQPDGPVLRFTLGYWVEAVLARLSAGELPMCVDVFSDVVLLDDVVSELRVPRADWDLFVDGALAGEFDPARLAVRESG